MRSAYSSKISKFLFSAVDNLIIILIFSCVGPDNVGHLFKLWHIDCDILSDKDVWSSLLDDPRLSGTILLDSLNIRLCSSSKFGCCIQTFGHSGVLNIYTIPLGCVLDDVYREEFKYQCDGWKENPLRSLLCRIYRKKD